MSRSAVDRTGGGIERVIRQVPARVGERIVQRALIRNAEAAAQGRLPISEHIPGKTDTGSEVVVIALAQAIGFGESTGSANAS